MADGTPIIIKKKKSHGHGHHGGAWKVAYADFVTAMMAFFMVMWIMGLSQDTKTIIQGYFNDPLGFTKNEPKTRVNIQPTNGSPYSMAGMRSGTAEEQVKGQKSAAAETRDEIRRDVSGSGDQELQALYEHLKVSITDEGLTIEFMENTGAVFFEVGSATIRPGARKLLSHIAPILAHTGRRMVIEGHTDGRPYPSSSYDNFDLSNDRAQAIRRALRDSGVPIRQFREVRGYADTRLKDPTDPMSAMNRRVTVLLPFNDIGGDHLNSLPSEIVRQGVQGVFKKPVYLDPKNPGVHPAVELGPDSAGKGR